MWEIARQLSWRLVAVVPLKLYTANPLISFCGQKCREDGVTYVKGTQNNQHRHAERPKYGLYWYNIMTKIHKHWALADPVTSFCGQNVGLVMQKEPRTSNTEIPSDQNKEKVKIPKHLNTEWPKYPDTYAQSDRIWKYRFAAKFCNSLMWPEILRGIGYVRG